MKEGPAIQYITLSLGITRCFLILCGTQYLLVDTSAVKYYEKFKHELAKHSISLSQIKFIFLTHHHTDHTGFLSVLLRESGARLIVHKNALPFLAEGVDHQAMTGSSGLVRFFMRVKKIFRLYRVCNPVIPDENALLIDSDNDTILRNYGIPAKIISLPGHTADSIALACDDGNCFAGDAAMTMLGFAKPAYWPLVAENPSGVRDCWMKLKEQHVKIVHISHGKSLNINDLTYIH
ncbi:MAG TPA: MBL fold metallo-hydrolase [Bacteroidales bacterium]|nr:MBL fold metallo-hydrolase [Bacteroidales bacterium]